MKKTILCLVLIASSLFALSGEEVYTQHCAACHKMEMPKGDPLAPPMPNVSRRIQQSITSKEKFVVFVKDYIQNPSKEKGFCRERAFNHFGVMPAIGKSMTKQERELVATWLFDNFQQKSTEANACENENCQGKKCNTKKQKCGAGKCGSKK